MEALNLLDSFLLSAEGGGFSAAARRLGVTPAAVSRNVARLEEQLGVRLFQRSTRKLTLTEAGERFLHEVSGPYDDLRDAFTRAGDDSQPAGTLKVALGMAFGRDYLVPLLGEFLERYPAIIPDWQFDNRPVDLIAGGFDAAIGGGIELNQGVIARDLAPVHVVAVAAPSYMRGRKPPGHPDELRQLDGIIRRSAGTGRLRSWVLTNRQGEHATAECRTRMIFDDPDAMAHAALRGYGVALLPMPFALSRLKSGELVRLLPDWKAELGSVSLYYPNKKLLPGKTRVFIDFVLEKFRGLNLTAE